MSSKVRSPIAILLILASVFSLYGCGGDGESDDDGDVGKFEDPFDGYSRFCTADYKPVCGKALPEATINCVTTPCFSHEYRTFSNRCVALNAKAQIAFADECDGIEDHLTYSDTPVRITEYADLPVDNSPITITKAEIQNDIVSLEISYAGGCGDHEINLYVSSLFMESNPVQTESLLSHVTEDSCDALVEDELTFDLLPLREFYRRSYGEGAGSIQIKGIGLYTFN